MTFYRNLALPFIGFSAILLGGLLAWGAAHLLKLEPCKTGALIPCGSFTNIGSIYDLDLNLANSCWFITTALLIVVLPVLLVIINSF